MRTYVSVCVCVCLRIHCYSPSLTLLLSLHCVCARSVYVWEYVNGFRSHYGKPNKVFNKRNTHTQVTSRISGWKLIRFVRI